MAGHGGGGGKIRTILIVILIFFVIGLLLYWIVTGGPARAWAAGMHFTNPIALIFGNGTTTGTYITLPWQPEATRGPDISDYVQAADQEQQSADQAPQQEEDTSRLSQYGDPSPYGGEVTIAGNNTSNNPGQEYIELQASGDNGAPIDITGWTLQSAVSGAEDFIPAAAQVFIGGSVNSVQHVLLDPGASAIVTTGASPVGVSFQENECTGYLNQLQPFYPALSGNCPAPGDVLPETAENLKTYGSACFDYLDSLSSCYFPGSNLPSNLSQNCRTFLSTALSYNGCVDMNRPQASFLQPSFRLYFSLRSPLWNPSHDIVRLLDNNGRIVDVLTY